MATKKTTTKKTAKSTKAAKTTVAKRSPKAVAKKTNRVVANRKCGIEEEGFRFLFLAMIVAGLLVAHGAIMVAIKANNDVSASSGPKVVYVSSEE